MEMIENEKLDDEHCKEEHDEIAMECYFVLSYAGVDEEQLVILSEKDCMSFL